MLILSIFIFLIFLICLNVPIAFSLALAGVFGLYMTEGAGSLVTVALDMYDGSTKFSLIAIPMFVLAGAIMNAGGVTKRLIEFVAALIGAVRGGLSMVSIGVSLFFAEISGSAVADVAALGTQVRLTRVSPSRICNTLMPAHAISTKKPITKTSAMITPKMRQFEGSDGRIESTPMCFLSNAAKHAP